MAAGGFGKEPLHVSGMRKLRGEGVGSGFAEYWKSPCGSGRASLQGVDAGVTSSRQDPSPVVRARFRSCEVGAGNRSDQEGDRAYPSVGSAWWVAWWACRSQGDEGVWVCRSGGSAIALGAWAGGPWGLALALAVRLNSLDQKARAWAARHLASHGGVTLRQSHGSPLAFLHRRRAS